MSLRTEPIEHLLDELSKRLGKDDGQRPDEDGSKDLESLSKPVRDFFVAVGMAHLFKQLNAGSTKTVENKKKDAAVGPEQPFSAYDLSGYEPVKAGGYTNLLGLVPAQALGLTGDAGHLFECSSISTGEMTVTILCHIHESAAIRERMARLAGGVA